MRIELPRGTLLPLALGVVLAGCEPSTGPAQPLQELPRSLTASEREVISSSNAFAFDILREVNVDDRRDNVFISPLSVSMALGMTMNGASGATFDEMRSVLGFGELSLDEINRSYRSLIDLLLGLDRSVEIGVANSIWYRDGFPVQDVFLATVEHAFDADIEPLDFDAPDAVGRINSWVDRATKGRIEEIIEGIRHDDVMFLINAIYFKGDWRERFDPDHTRPADFVRLDGSTVAVPMMSRTGEYRYAASDTRQVVDLPYGNGAFTMTIVVPSGSHDVNSLIAELDAGGWERILAGLTDPMEISVELPRFRMEYEKGLVESLQALGMRTPFAPGFADFTGMSPLGERLYISDVKHKTFVDVNEEGTEAAAATSVTVRVTSAPPSIRVDRPFLFAIRERFSGTILFAGKIVDPTATGSDG